MNSNILKRHKDIRVGMFLGMGPIAGAHFYRKFEESFIGMSDYEHPTVLCYSNPTKPRRIPGPDCSSNDPSPALYEGMDFFRRNEVNFVLAPCNSLMFYREKLEEYSGIRIVDIVNEVAAAIEERHSSVRTIGLLSTAYTLRWGLYQRALESLLSDVEIVELDAIYQNEIDKAIEEVKRGLHTLNDSPQKRIVRAVRYLMSLGAQIVIEGCTELPCALDAEDFYEIPLIDSSLILAQAGVRLVQEIRSESSRV